MIRSITIGLKISAKSRFKLWFLLFDACTTPNLGSRPFFQIMFTNNFLLFLFVLFILGLFIKENGFTHNFLCLSIIGQGLNIFDLFIVDLLWWRNTKRVRLRKMPEKELYQNPKKHIEAFIRAFIMYLLIALIDGYILTLL